MRHTVAAFRLAICLAVLSAAPAFSQTTDDEATSKTAAAPVAYVYVQTTNGVNAYDAAANGKLTLVKGSPFKTVGEMIGSNGKYFITLGTNWIHVYAVESSGAIGKQVSTVNTQDYDGAACGPTTDAGLDHTGQNLSVMLEYGSCNAFQSFSISKTSGELTFDGALVASNSQFDFFFPMPAITANDKFAYVALNGTNSNGGAAGPLTGFTRGHDGVLQFLNFRETDPPTSTNLQTGTTYEWVLNSVAADPTNHLAVVLYGYDGLIPYEQNTAVQLASYTVESDGNLVSTNTYEDMPVPIVCPNVIRMSPSGKLLAVGGDGDCPDDGPNAPGLQILHFNGSSPITPYSKVLTNDWFSQSSLHWDNNNHLYAFGFSKPEGKYQLFVYTITPTSISEAPGSPYTITANYLDSIYNSLVVVPK